MAKYFDSETETYKPIPQANYYVLAKDTALSGWGFATGKINVVVVPCDSREDAELVKTYCLQRSDIENPRIVTRPPQQLHDILYSLIPDWVKVAFNVLSSPKPARTHLSQSFEGDC